MISKKINQSFKIGIFILIVIGSFLLFPKLAKAYCCPAAIHSDGSYDCYDECNGTWAGGFCFAAGSVWYSDVGYLCKNGVDCFYPSDTGWTKDAKFPDTDQYNGSPCAVYSNFNPLWLSCDKNGEGVWDASEKKCIQCNVKVESKICGSAGTVSTDTCVDTNNDGILDYCLSLGCLAAGDGECETACPVGGVSPECDDATDGLNVPATYGIGVCNNCVFAGPPTVCSWQDDNCGDSPCPAEQRRQTCGPATCAAGVCVKGTTQCIVDPVCDCEPTCSCHCPAGIPCTGGRCDGGLVPCGRTCDDWCTKNCECAPCTLCHLFVLLKRIVDFLTISIIFPLAILMIVVGGVMFLTAGGDPGRIGTAKKILTATVIGLAIILLAWLIVDTVIMFLVPATSPYQNWETINCPVCGDGICESGEDTTNCPADCHA